LKLVVGLSVSAAPPAVEDVLQPPLGKPGPEIYQLQTRSSTSFRTPAPEPEVRKGRNYCYCIIVILARM